MVLSLVNSNTVLDGAESLPQNIIEIGGMHIKDPKPIPSDIDEFLLKCKKGAVLVSFGSNFRSDEFGGKRIEEILDAFRQLPDYNFIWKFETTEMLKNVPPNVMTRAWLSQNDILAHGSIKAFVSHVGLLSLQEATWHAVPLIGVPIFVDQHSNLQKSIAAGVAVRVDFKTLTSEELKSAISEVLVNPNYRENMRKRSNLFRDQPQKPLDRAIWWCEYVLRNPQPTHLRQMDFNLGLLGYQYWDIQVIILLIILLIACLTIKLIKFIFARKNYQKVDGSKKKN